MTPFPSPSHKSGRHIHNPLFQHFFSTFLELQQLYDTTNLAEILKRLRSFQSLTPSPHQIIVLSYPVL